MITLFAWSQATKTAARLDPKELEGIQVELLARHDVLWIDLSEPTPEEEQLVFQKFMPIHPLSLEDVTRLRREPSAPPHFPKVEEFPDYLFVIVNPLRGDYLRSLTTEVEERGIKPFTQLSAVLTDKVLITHHYDKLPCVGQLDDFLKRHGAQAARGPDFFFHLVLDNTVDQYAPALDYVNDGLDAMELEVVQNPQRSLFQGLLRLKHEVIVLRKTLIYEREVLVRLARGEFALVDERETVYYRNVYDHLVRFAELIEGSREMLADLMQSYLASASNKLSEIMKVLTMISTAVLPMTLIAGVYGMNFTHMPEIEQVWGYPFALGLMVLTAIGSLGFFRWRSWI